MTARLDRVESLLQEVLAALQDHTIAPAVLGVPEATDAPEDGTTAGRDALAYMNEHHPAAPAAGDLEETGS